MEKGWGKSNRVLGGKCGFDAENSSWGFEEFSSIFKLRRRRDEFLVNDRLIILAEVHVLPAIVVPEEPVKIIEPLSSIEGNQASGTSVSQYQGHSYCQQVVQTTENASEENLDDDDDVESEEDPDDDGDASSLVSDDGVRDISPLNQSSVEKDGIRCVAAETEVSNGENDDAPKEDVDDDVASSLVSNDGARDVISQDQVKSLEDASQSVENGGRGFNSVPSVIETSNTLKEIQPLKETLDVYGFEVYSSQVEKVTHIFERYPSMAFGFRPKNQQIRRAYMNQLLSLIETLCQSPEKLSEDDLSNAEDTLVDLIDAGFKLNWLKIKLNEVSEKKKMEQGSGARLQTMEEQLQKLKLMVLDLETQMQKEKVEALAARAPLSFYDVVC